jgi:long-chain acyl-CoA synthetase
VRKKYDVSSMRWIMHGAAPCPVHVKKEMMDWFGPVIHEYYSSTEGGGVYVGPHEWLKKPGTVGRAVPGVEVKLLDADGNYRGDWFTLGDVGRFDADGDLFLTGRTAELIISGGVNIYPVEIDEVLIRHEGVADAAVVGVPNEDWGEEIKAVVELKAGWAPTPQTAQSILDFAKDRLPGFQRPRSVDFVSALPRSPAGKVLRAQVRAPYWKGRSTAI